MSADSHDPKPPRLRPDWPGGSELRIRHRSSALSGNPWGDPVERELCVYLPPGYQEAGEPLLALWDLAAFGNAGPGHMNWRAHGEALAPRLDRLIATGALPPVVVPLPDCFTSLGGNQYLNAPGVGRYADYLIEELVPLLASRVNVHDGREGRAIFGKSSGGYGALWHAMNFPDCWGAAASHAGDCGFEWLFRPELPTACRVLSRHGGDPRRFLEAFWATPQPGRDDWSTLLIIAMAASFDADPGAPGRPRLPMDLRTCKLDEERWARWLEHDPLHNVEHHVDALQTLNGLYLDVGSEDEYNTQFGTRALSARLEDLGISHHFEEFPGGHRNLDWRLDHSLPYLARALRGTGSTSSAQRADP